MSLSEGFLAIVAYISMIVATMRASSRVFYLNDHGCIGVMQGSPILGPKDVENINDTTAEWDITFVFEQGVRLALFPETFDYEEYDDDTKKTFTVKYDEKKNNFCRTPYDQDNSLIRSISSNLMTKKNGVNDDGQTKRVIFLLEQVRRVKPIFFFQAMIFSFQNFFKKSETDYASNDERDNFGEKEETWDYKIKRRAFVEFNATSGDNTTTSVTAHAPDTFSDLRSKFGISEKDFFSSILKAGPFIQFESNSKGAARVGGIFFFTPDGAYMIKTIKKEEAETFLKMLPKYHKHMRVYGRKTLLTRFCGMFTVLSETRRSNEEQIFVIMNSVFPAESSSFITERYDLKGSTVGRQCTEEEKRRKGSNAVLKDLDLVEEAALIRSYALSPTRSLSRNVFELGLKNKAALLSQLRKDVKLLVDCNVMDYSLLVGVVNMDTVRLGISSIEAMDHSKFIEAQFSPRSKGKRSKVERVVKSILLPVRIFSAPISYLGKIVITLGDSGLSSILTLPFPYYGANVCGVDGGSLSKMKGEKAGKRCTFYLGLIDFLQPWTKRKLVERYLKTLMGYDTHEISCVDPEEYGTRFLSFMDEYLS